MEQTTQRLNNVSTADATNEFTLDTLATEALLPEILMISSYPPRICGIATYSQDLLNALTNQFGQSFSFKIAALDKNNTYEYYKDEVKYVIPSSSAAAFSSLANTLNKDDNLSLIFLQHEFGLFGGENGDYILHFLTEIEKPVIVTFHTILPEPTTAIFHLVNQIGKAVNCIIVMTHLAKNILTKTYNVPASKIMVIPHGTHLLSSTKQVTKKASLHFSDRFVLATFGLINSDKSIETALDALPAIIKKNPQVIYLIIGETHPEVVKNEGERYRNFLYDKVLENKLQNHVLFINKYLSLESLLAYLQRTDIYLFTSKNPLQAVSGTLAYAMGCGCPVISTPIPHAKELLDGAGLNFNFQDSKGLADAANYLIGKPLLLAQMKLKAIQQISPTAWQNSAVAHIHAAQTNIAATITLRYTLPIISLEHIRSLTTNIGIIQFAKICIPDAQSGYTLDDNARALIAVTQHYELTGDIVDLELINIYIDFIISCQQAEGNFLNYMDIEGSFFVKNNDENLEDSNGRAVWALGEFLKYKHLFAESYTEKAVNCLKKALAHIEQFKSPRAIAFAIKGLYHFHTYQPDSNTIHLINVLADELVSKYRGVSDHNWKWFEQYLTYANSILPEALLLAANVTKSRLFKDIALSSFNFLLSIIFRNNQIKVVSNNGWYHKDSTAHEFGEQPIDIAYTIIALALFYETTQDDTYLQKITIAFSWFLGNNHLKQIIYNPSNGGCYDGLEERYVNLNQGAESTVSYLLARLTIEKYESIQNDQATPHQLYH